MSDLRVRAYNVRFGDAFLLSIPDLDDSGQETVRHILIDVGNAYGKEGGNDDVFGPVVDDILNVLDGHPLDLYIMTHEHMDHVQGLLSAENDRDDSLTELLKTQYTWFTASAAPDYHDTHPEAKELHTTMLSVYDEIATFVELRGTDAQPLAVDTLLRLNNSTRTGDCVDYLRGLAPIVSYVHRGMALRSGEHHPFDEARFEVWAPEEDTSAYYGHFHPMTLGMTPASDDTSDAGLTPVTPPRGVDMSAFYNLVDLRRAYGYNLLAIDRAKNNTSVVFCLEWRGWRLLFSGDAEIRSWRQMMKSDKAHHFVQPVHFLKVSHHGSHNGTPDSDTLDRILPLDGDQDGRTRYALVSTYEGQYSGVPDPMTLSRLAPRCDRLLNLNAEAGPADWVDLVFSDDGSSRVIVPTSD